MVLEFYDSTNKSFLFITKINMQLVS